MPIESHHPPVSIPPVDFWTFLFERPDREYPDDHVLFVDVATRKKHTFRDIRTTSVEIGRGLQKQWRWQKRDVMVLFSPNTADIGALVSGILWAGGVVCPVNNLYTVGELVSVLKSSGAKALTTHLSCFEVAREAALIVGLPLNRIILIGEPDTKEKTKHFSSLRDLSIGGQKVSINPKEDLAFLVYSSGTTGLPKGVMLSHENIVGNILQCYASENHQMTWNNDSVISFLPMFHIYGVAVMAFHPIYNGVTVHVMQQFDLPQLCQSIQSSKITVAYVVPPVVLALAKHPVVDKYDLSSLREIHSAAAPLGTDLIDVIHKRLKVPIKQSYGMSETSPVITTQSRESWNKPPGSVGKLLASMSMKVMDGEHEVPPGQEGEIWMKGPNIFKGYYKNPKATADAITDGWFRSGDIGYIDNDGNIFLTDRFKELIKYNGFQVAPAQLEGLLLGHPAVNDVAVVGVYSKERVTELPRAYIVPAQGHTAGEDLEKVISAWLNEKVAPYKKLRGGIRFVDEIPKSATGKILRRVLAEQAKSEQEGSLKAKL
ncbi:putative phenylacetyl-CoA ligase [Leptodontidium sp. MPI-SDFR-AT-0119]|nr:putative phenylacetyl-CoA ligase [Leptodontidium sp. MPI-SDFR-AT-0119]